MASVPKPKIHPAADFWPGLPQLWVRGSWAGLAVAVVFTTLANTLLLAIGVFHDWMTTNLILIGLSTLAISWLIAWWQSRNWRLALQREGGSPMGGSKEAGVTEKEEEQRERLFREAQQLYLNNDWVRTEQLLLVLLKQDSRDVESRLMLCTLWQHQGRLAEAGRQLDRLDRLEAASHWQYEIGSLRQKLKAATTPDATDANTRDAGTTEAGTTEADTTEVETETEASPGRLAA